MSWVALGLVGAMTGLDATSFPQAMVSRPLVAGTLAGLVFGHPQSGLLIGAIMEVFALVILPFGAARYPESGTAAAGAAAAYAIVAGSTVDPRLIVITVAFALTWEQVTGASVIFQRRLNERLVSGLPSDPGAADRVERRHLFALALDAVRGAWAVVLGAAIGILLLRAFAPTFGFSPTTSSYLLMIGIAAMLGAASSLFGGLRQRAVAFAAGILFGSLLLLL